MPSELRPLPARRVLVVDDSQDGADSLGLILQALGAQASVTYDGPSALALLDSFKPDIVLLDIGMPGMDGYDVARRIRAERAFDRVLLVALTGYGQEEDRRRCADAGFDHHLVKPLEVKELEHVLGSPDGIRRSLSS
jgi:CheY-like chemotaxis protein